MEREVINLGRVAFNPRGKWAEDVEYKKLDTVFHIDSTYYAKEDNVGEAPSKESTVWGAMATGGNVNNAADEEDLTAVEENGSAVIKINDRLYNPDNFSGKGYKILRKNVRSIDLAVVKVTVNSVPTTDGEISFTINNVDSHITLSKDTHNTTALAATAISEALATDHEDYDVVAEENVITLTRKHSGSVEASAYDVNATGMTLSLEDSTKTVKRNLITQVMINEPNTTYEVRYDFDLDGNSVEVAENSVLKFDGGSISNGTLTGDFEAAFSSGELVDYVQCKVTGVVTFAQRSSIYVIEPKVWNITEGYMEKDVNGHYNDKQYDDAYNNGIGFSNAIRWAYDHGYAGVCFKRGTYCFVLTNNNYPTIELTELFDFDINLNSSKLCFIIDSSYVNKYVTDIPTDNTWNYGGAIFFLSGCTNVSIHNGELVGERKLRSYTDSKEKWTEKSYGILVSGALVYNTHIYDIVAHDFGGDCVAAGMGGMYVNRTSRYWVCNWNCFNKTRTKSATYIESPTVIREDPNNIYCVSQTDLYLLDDVVSPRLNPEIPSHKKALEDKVFTLCNNSGYTRLSNVFNAIIDVITYNKSDHTKPARVIKTSFLEDFQLSPNEDAFRLQFYKDKDLPEEGEETKIGIWIKANRGLVIERCHFYNCQRGNFSGSCMDTVFRDCLFERFEYDNYPVPVYPDSTRYQIDIEDSFCNYVSVSNCRFLTSSTDTGKLLFGVKKLVFHDNNCDTGLTIYNNLTSDIYSNTFMKDVAVSGVFRSADRTWGSGCDIRNIHVHHNHFINGAANPTQNDNNTNWFIHDNDYDIKTRLGNTLGLIRNSRFTFYTDNPIAMDAEEYRDCVFKMDKSFDSKTLRNYKPGSSVSNRNIGCTYDRVSLSLVLKTDRNPNMLAKDCKFINGGHLNITYSGQPADFTDKEFTTDIMNCYFDVKSTCNALAYTNLCKSLKIKFTNCIFDGYITTNVNYFICSQPNLEIIFDNCVFNCKAENQKYISPNMFVYSARNNTNVGYVTMINCKIPEGILLSKRDKAQPQGISGTTAERPLYMPAGSMYMDTDLNKAIWWNGTTWVDKDGNPADTKQQGATKDRPTGVNLGFIYKDTTLNKLIVWDGSAWVNMDGSSLDAATQSDEIPKEVADDNTSVNEGDTTVVNEEDATETKNEVTEDPT